MPGHDAFSGKADVSGFEVVILRLPNAVAALQGAVARLRRPGAIRAVAVLAHYALRTVRRIAADTGCQLRQIEKFVRLTSQFVCYHGRLGGDRGNDGHAHPAALQGFDEGPEIAVAGE
jgi:hypothetical protein